MLNGYPGRGVFQKRQVSIQVAQERDVKIAACLMRRDLIKIFKKYAPLIDAQNSKLMTLPLGVVGLASVPWLAACFQFLVTLPSFLEMTPFMDRSFRSVCFWFSKYRDDQMIGEELSGVDLESFFCSLQDMNPIVFKEDSEVNFQKVLDFFFDRAFLSIDGKNSWDEFLALNPEWVIDLGEGRQVERVLKRVFTFAPSDIVLYFSRSSPKDLLGSRYVLFCEKKIFFYNLEAFIEKRLTSEGMSYIFYAKVAEEWHKIDGESVKKVSLGIVKKALKGGVLLRYSKEFF